MFQLLQLLPRLVHKFAAPLDALLQFLLSSFDITKLLLVRLAHRIHPESTRRD